MGHHLDQELPQRVGIAPDLEPGLEHHLQLLHVLGGQIAQRADCRAKLALDIQFTGRERRERRFLWRLSRDASRPGSVRQARGGLCGVAGA
jgi:hypothetical protein